MEAAPWSARPGAGIDRPISVIIADDHTVVRERDPRRAEREQDAVQVIAEAADVPSTIAKCASTSPTLTLD